MAAMIPGRAASSMRDLARVELEDLEPRGLVGPVDQHVAIEAAGAQQRRVEDLGPVGGGHEITPTRGSKPSISDQQLVERLLALVVRHRRPALRPCPGRRARR